MKKAVKKSSILISILAILTLSFLLGMTIISNADKTAASANSQDLFGIHEPTRQEIREKKKLKKQLESYNKKSNWNSDTASKITTVTGELEEFLPNFRKMHDDAKEEGDLSSFYSADAIDNYLSLATSIASICGPYGIAISGALQLTNGIFQAIAAGEPATSEIAMAEDRLTQQLTEIKSQLTEIEEQINELSNQIAVL